MSSQATIKLTNIPTIALVGRVNVGKSMLFNRLIEQKKAIVSETPGTTRTTNEGLIHWRGKYIKILDTGGLTFTDVVPLENEILKQTEKAMKKADLIVFVADAIDGIMPQEKELAKRLRRVINKPVLFVANKTDKQEIEYGLTGAEWSRLGLGQPFPLSAINGRNTGDFLDLVYKTLIKHKKRPITIKDEKIKIINVSIIGKPNAGKSSIFNKLIGEDKVIVSSMPHTTREPHDTLVVYPEIKDGKTIEHLINFVDTAGIRRKARVEGALEREGISKSIQMIDRSEIILFVVDGQETISSQDQQLGGLLEKAGRSVIILINKWDLAEDNSDANRNAIKEMIYSAFPHLSFAPILLVSGLTGTSVHQVFNQILKAAQARETVVPNNLLHGFIKYATSKHLPSRDKGTRQPKIMGMRQLATDPPVFEALIKYRTSLHRSYLNFLERQLREQFDFYATPIIIKLSKMKR